MGFWNWLKNRKHGKEYLSVLGRDKESQDFNKKTFSVYRKEKPGKGHIAYTLIDGNNKILATAYAVEEDKNIQVQKMNVDSRFREKNIGSLFMKLLEQDARLKGKKQLTTNSEKNAVEFCKKAGFRKNEEAGIREGYKTPMVKKVQKNGIKFPAILSQRQKKEKMLKRRPKI